MRPGKRNLITDIKGLYIGNSEDHSIKTGVTVLIGDRPFVAGVSVMGGAPGTRETDLLAPDKMIQEIDALVLSGGSTILVCFNFGNPFNHKQVFFSKASPK